MKKKVLLSLLIVLLSLTVIMAGVACGPKTPTSTTYKLVFDKNGGEGTMADKTGLKTGDKINLDEIECEFTLEDYEFIGWAKSKEGKPESEIEIRKQNVTVYAIWKEIVEEDNDVDFGDVLNGVVYSLGNVTDKLAAIGKDAHMDATIYVTIGDTSVDVRFAGSFSESEAADNKGFISVSVDNKAYFTLYAEDNIVYFGEALTQDEMSWFKLSQLKSAEIISTYFAKLPALISAQELEAGFLEAFLKKPLPVEGIELTLDGILGIMGNNMISGMLFETAIDTANTTFNPDEEEYDGNFEVTILLDDIAGVLSSVMVKNLLDGFLKGKTIEELLAGLDSGLAGIIDMVAGVVFNGTLSELLNGEIDIYPEIKIVGSIENGMLKSFGLSYNNSEAEGMVVGFGIKDLVISDKATANIKPADMPEVASIKDAAIKLSLDIEIPGKGIEDAVIEAYIIPDFDIVKQVIDGVDTITGLDLTRASAFAIAKVGGVEIDLAADYNRNGNKEVRIDLAGLYEFVGIVVPTETKYYIPFDLDAWFNGLFDKEEGSQNSILFAEGDEPVGNSLDEIIDIFVDLFTGGEFDFMAIAGKIGNILDILTVGVDVLTDSIVDGKLVGTLLLDNIVKTELLAESLWIGEFVTTHLNKENVVDSIVNGIAGALEDDEFTLEKMLEIIGTYSGLEDVTEADLLALQLGAEFIRTEERGVGFALTLYTGETIVARLSLAIDIVGTYPSEYALTTGFSTDHNLETEDAQQHIIAGLKDILAGYEEMTK